MKRTWRIGHILGAGTLTLVLSLTGLIATTVSNSVARETRNRIGIQLEQRARIAADRFDQFLWSMKQETQFLAKTVTLFTDNEPAVIRQSLERLQTFIPMFSWIGYADARGTVLAATGGILEGQSLAERPVYAEGIKGYFAGDVHDAVLLAKLLPNPSGETMKFVDFSYAVYGSGKEPIGVLAAHISWEWIGQLRNSFISADSTGKSELMILSSRDGMVILGPENEVGTVPKYGPAIEGGSGFFDYDDSRQSSYLAGYAKSGGYSDFPGFGWTIVAREPLAQATAVVKTQIRRIWTIGLLASLAAGAAAWFLSRAVSRPLEALLRQSEALRQGEIDVITGKTVVTEIAGLAESLNHLANNLNRMEGIALHDPLTALHNRAGAREWLEAAKARCIREKLSLSILVLDLDGFKPINDRFGHEAGDAALIAVARRLLQLARAEELLARWGGDEFILVQFRPNGDPSGMEPLAGRILENIRKPIQWNGTSFTVGCSIGGTVWDPRSAQGWTTALSVADSALYRSKRAGKGRFTLL